jgi:hypothetical protein
MSNAITTKHNLDFEVAESPYNFFNDGHQMFRVGTCEGQWGFTKDCFYILSVANKVQGNGHLDDVFEWFEHSCKSHNRNLIILSVMNSSFYDHLINKRGFTPLDEKRDNLIKIFNKKHYKNLLLKGNEIIDKKTITCIDK